MPSSSYVLCTHFAMVCAHSSAYFLRTQFPLFWRTHTSSYALFFSSISPSLFTSHRITSHHITSHHITSHHITSHHITSYHIASHHITSHHITSHHITSHHITSHHITSHHITSHHITSHHITSHHITSHHIPSHGMLRIAHCAMNEIVKVLCEPGHCQGWKQQDLYTSTLIVHCATGAVGC